jgi:hypothetical protein
MSTLAEIEAALPTLSAEELARVEVAVRRLQRELEMPVHPEGADARFDGRSWPKTGEEITALLAELDALPPLLTAQDADRFEKWRVEERERQKSLSGGNGLAIVRLFS